MWLTSLFKPKPDSNRVEKAQAIAPKSSKSPERQRDGKSAPAAQPVEPPPITIASPNQIEYDETLIARLKSDHAAVLALYSNVTNLLKAGQWEAVPAAVREVRIALYGHLLTEGVKLYSYMRRHLAEDQTMFEVYRSFRKEMDEIGRAAFAFFDKYQDAESMASAEARRAFKVEFEIIGKVLLDRIRREESVLYPLYIPA